MKASYKVSGSKRKEMVGIIGEVVGMKPVYKFMPTCAFVIGGITVEKDGTMVWGERTDEDTIRRVIAALEDAGFTPEEIDSAPAAEDEATDKAETVTASEEAPAENTGDENADVLTISLPKDGFTEGAIDSLRKLVEAKATLIKKALGADRLTIDADGDKVSFPWWDRLPEPDEIKSYTAFIAALGKMAKEAKRVTAKETDVESEKYAFRCFLLRLGFIGSGFKTERKILMQRLSGSAAFPNKEKADAFNEAQKAKAAAAKEVRS